MKLASLFALYLYKNHRLDLPGIGTFYLDPAVLSTLENARQKSATADGISFENNPSVKESADLIAFISLHTGKMKALASSDLDSHLQLAQQFLNIGKPFVVEGIGTLVKKRPGELEFVPLTVSAERIKEYKTKETVQAAPQETTPAEYEPFIDAPSKGNWKKPVFALLILVVTGLAFWGAYTVYKSKKAAPAAEETNVAVSPAPSPADTITTSAPLEKDTAATGYYTYVLERVGRERALKRYEQLKGFNWPVQLETRDSVTFKLFMRLPGTPADTARIADSLTIRSGKKVRVEP